jgi:lauroyl/myristoyl acyltransferase
MADSLHQLRRGATQLAVRQAIAVSGALPIGVQRSAVRSLVALAGSVPMLRRTVRENMCLALGDDVPDQAERLYFRHAGWFLSNALATYHHGLIGASIPETVKFDESIRILDEAVAEGRGVILVAPHWSGHELVAASINLRHRMVMLVREAPTSERAVRKLKWYKALGVEIVLRPSGTSTIQDALAYLKVLKGGKMLAITPDLLAGPEQGVEISIFGRPARLHGGAFVLAILAGAPMIRVSGQRQRDWNAVLTFERAPVVDASNRDAAIRALAQDWCRWFEDRMRANPENWLFWLDKRWSRFLRTTPRTSAAK